MRRHIILIIASITLWAAPARAERIPCYPVERNIIQLDGLLNDWKGASGVGVDEASKVLKGKANWSGEADLSYDVFCNHTKTTIYLAVRVADEYFIRTRKGRGDDHVQLTFGKQRLLVYPGDMRKIKGKLVWKGGKRRRRVKGVQMAEALQRNGYSLEIAILTSSIPGYRTGAPSFSGSVQVMDSDSKAGMRTQTVMSTAPAGRGRFVFAQAEVQMKAFLKARGYKRSQIRARKVANVVGDKRLETVVLVGKTIGILGEGLPQGGFFYYNLPARRGKDVYWLKVRDLNGDGKSEMVTRFVERSDTGRRELIAVYRYNETNKFLRSFSHEILKGQKKRVILNRYTFKARKKRRKVVGVDLIFDKPQARGFTKATYKEAPSTDAQSIILPWDEEKKRHFRFEGDSYFQM